MGILWRGVKNCVVGCANVNVVLGEGMRVGIGFIPRQNGGNDCFMKSVLGSLTFILNCLLRLIMPYCNRSMYVTNISLNCIVSDIPRILSSVDDVHFPQSLLQYDHDTSTFGILHKLHAKQHWQHHL
jgi:hypothetical protein